MVLSTTSIKKENISNKLSIYSVIDLPMPVVQVSIAVVRMVHGRYSSSGQQLLQLLLYSSGGLKAGPVII